MIESGTLGGSRSYATGVNDRYEVAGFSETVNGQLHAVVWRHGRLIDLGTPDDQTSTATAINNRGTIVGEVRADMNTTVPVLWRPSGRTHSCRSRLVSSAPPRRRSTTRATSPATRSARAAIRRTCGGTVR